MINEASDENVEAVAVIQAAAVQDTIVQLSSLISDEEASRSSSRHLRYCGTYRCGAVAGFGKRE